MMASCCIDKTSSAELTEAINAMFRWYKNAVVCYVYLSDVAWNTDEAIMTEMLRHSRWFTRGWTLQELIAPHCIEFYSRDWRKLATKAELCNLLSSITGIDVPIFKGADLADISIARRMSWASHRKTTRIEDIAYCLLGIFDINLPLIYGEGTKAFRRLQEAIMGTTHDQSLFAWGRIVDQPSDLIDREQELGVKSIPWKPPQQREPLLGLFATTPEDFATSSEISPVDHGYAHRLNRQRPPTVVNGGALVDLVIFKTMTAATYWDNPPVAQPQKVELAVLLCRVGNSRTQLVALVLRQWGDDYYSRTRELVPVELFVSQFRFQKWTQTRHLIPLRPFELFHGDILIRRWTSSFRCIGVDRPTTPNGPAWRQKWQDTVLRLEEHTAGDEEITFFFEVQRDCGVAITLRRVWQAMEPLGSLLVGASPFHSSDTKAEEGIEIPKWIPEHGASFRYPAYSRIMTIPWGIWELKAGDLPYLSVKVDRMLLDGGGAVDVMDFSLYPRNHSQDKLN
jgi:hypothetical protein